MELTFWNKLEMYGYRVLGALCVAALVANVYKHGWHVVSMLTPIVLASPASCVPRVGCVLGTELRTGWNQRAGVLRSTRSGKSRVPEHIRP